MVETKVKYQNCYVLTVSIFKFSASLSKILLNKKLISLPLQAFLKLIKMLPYRSILRFSIKALKILFYDCYFEHNFWNICLETPLGTIKNCCKIGAKVDSQTVVEIKLVWWKKGHLGEHKAFPDAYSIEFGSLLGLLNFVQSSRNTLYSETIYWDF